MVEEPPDGQSQPLLPDSIESPSKIEPPTAVRIPDDSKSAAKRSVDTLFGMSVQSGPAAAINAFSALSEAVQSKQLDNDAEGMRRSFDLEEKQLAAQERDRDAQRKHDTERDKREDARQWRTEILTYILTAFIILVVSAIVVGLFWNNQHQVAIPMVSGLLGLGGGYIGGHGSGYKQATKELGRGEADKADEK